jgi:hypothetical protein
MITDQAAIREVSTFSLDWRAISIIRDSPQLRHFDATSLHHRLRLAFASDPISVTRELTQAHGQRARSLSVEVPNSAPQQNLIRYPAKPRRRQLHHVLQRPFTRVHRLQPLRIRLLETSAERWVGVRGGVAPTRFCFSNKNVPAIIGVT